MIVGIDFGSSTVDSCLYDTKKDKYTFFSLERSETNDCSLEKIIINNIFKKEIIESRKVIVTGGKSLLFKDYINIENINIKIIKISEIDAIATGGRFLSGQNKGLVVSLGTGSAMILFNNQKITHLKGTGIGGGTLMGLSNAILKEELNFEDLEKLSFKGKTENINTSIKEVVGDKLGNLPTDLVASFFSKYNKRSKKEDIVFGIFSFIAESLTMLIIEKALRNDLKDIVIGGKLSKSRVIKNHMKYFEKIFNLKFIFPENSGFLTVMGAIQKSI